MVLKCRVTRPGLDNPTESLRALCLFLAGMILLFVMFLVTIGMVILIYKRSSRRRQLREYEVLEPLCMEDDEDTTV